MGSCSAYSVRVASVQYQQRRIGSFEEFATQVEYFVDIAADYDADFVAFPGYAGGVFVAVGDLNGDGRADLVAFGEYGVSVSLSNGTGFGAAGASGH